jgi:glycosyltransferase involved in cell wall biosynthesis
VKPVLVCAPGANLDDFGSMGRFLKYVAESLEERGCSPIILGAREFEAARKTHVVLRLLDLARVPWMAVYWAFAFQVWLASGRPVIAATSQEYVVPFGFRVQIPIYHDLIQYFFPRNLTSAFFYRFYLPWVTRRLGFIYCVTRATGRMVCRIVGTVPYRVCGVPIDKRFCLQTRERGEDQPYRFVWVGTLGKHKNHRQVLDFLQNDADTRGASTLAMIVPHTDAEALTDEVAARGLAERVQVLSKLSEDALTAVYARSDFVLSTSKLEGFCMPVLEAALCGCRPIVPNRATFRENFGRIASLTPRDAQRLDLPAADAAAPSVMDRASVASEARKIDDAVRKELSTAMDEIALAVAMQRKDELLCGRG